MIFDVLTSFGHSFEVNSIVELTPAKNYSILMKALMLPRFAHNYFQVN